MAIALWIIGGIAVFVYLFSPILVRFSLRQKVPSHMEVMSPGDLPAEVRDFFDSTARRLETAGFSPDVILRIRALSPNLFTLASFFSRGPVHDVAAAFAIFEERGEPPRLLSLYVEICNEFVDGREVCTNNSHDLAPFPWGPDKLVFQFPEVTDPAELYEVHARILAGGQGDRPEKKAGPAPNRIADHLRDGIRDELDQKVAQGLFYRVDEEGEYRPTWKGAYLMTWGQLWPVRWIRIRLRKKQSLALLAELGMAVHRA